MSLDPEEPEPEPELLLSSLLAPLDSPDDSDSLEDSPGPVSVVPPPPDVLLEVSSPVSLSLCDAAVSGTVVVTAPLVPAVETSLTSLTSSPPPMVFSTMHAPASTGNTSNAPRQPIACSGSRAHAHARVARDEHARARPIDGEWHDRVQTAAKPRIIAANVDRFLVQKDGKVVEWTEAKLRKQLRAGHLTGVELARRPEEDNWTPLHDLAMFREEVPHVGEPRDIARRREVSGFAWNALAFAGVSIFFLGPSVASLIWAIFLVGHAARALPIALELWREGKLLGLGSASPGNALPPSTDTNALLSGANESAPVAALPSGDRFTADLAEVRTLLARRPAAEVAPLLEELDRVAASVAELRERIAKLASLTGPEERDTIAVRVQQAETALADAGGDDELLLRRLDVLRERALADERARRTLERLHIRESLAEDQMQQLRLELVRAEADDLEPSDLSERLEQMRREAEAAEDVELLLAR